MGLGLPISEEGQEEQKRTSSEASSMPSPLWTDLSEGPQMKRRSFQGWV